MEPTLSQGSGYGLIIGGSAFFAIVINFTTYLFNKKTKQAADEFVSGSRSIGFGLLLSSIMSNWIWSLTILMPGVEAYNIGIMGPYAYALGGLLQVSVFSIVSSKIKKNGNMITTFPEMGYFRFGKAGHIIFLCSGLICNAIVSSCILLGGSAVFEAITGVSQYATLWLIPIGCSLYIGFGGLRATFISDAAHTSIILIFIIIFLFVVFVSSDKLGSAEKMWELLHQLDPVKDNYHGSYLTFRSKQGAIFAVISIITGFGLVVNDQAYLSRAVASDPKITSKAYFFASICWFVVPFSMGLLGLAARALSTYSDFPQISALEISEGLPSVVTISYLMGKSGSAMILVMIFFSVTSSFSGELIATSTLLSYDVYKRYIKPNANPKEVIHAARVSILIWAIFSSALASIFYGAAGISMGWLFNFLGCSTSSSVVPIVLTFTWKKLNKVGAVGGSAGGMILGLSMWLVSCKIITGEINVTNLSTQWVSFTGNVVSLFSGAITSVIASLIWPADFDWDKTRNKSSLTKHETTDSDESEIDTDESKDTNESEDYQKNHDKNSDLVVTIEVDDIDYKHLDQQFKKYWRMVVVLVIILTFVIPVPLGASPYIFSPGFLLGIVIISIIWLFGSFFFVVVKPIIESRQFFWNLIHK